MKVTIAIVFIVLWGSSIYLYLDSGLGFNYEETWGDIEDHSILNTKTGSVAIKPAIIDYYIDSGYAFGYRLETKDVVCKDGKYPRIMLELDPIYFTLNIETGKVREFDDVSLFFKILKGAGIYSFEQLKDVNRSNTMANLKKRYSESGIYGSCIASN